MLIFILLFILLSFGIVLYTFLLVSTSFLSSSLRNGVVCGRLFAQQRRCRLGDRAGLVRDPVHPARSHQDGAGAHPDGQARQASQMKLLIRKNPRFRATRGFFYNPRSI